MQLPITIRFQRKRRQRSPLRSPWAWAGVVGVVLLSAVVYAHSVVRTPATASPRQATIELTSEPLGASIRLDGREWGRTPARLRVEEGEHEVMLSLANYADTRLRVVARAGRTTPVRARLWLRTAVVTELRAPLPGSSIQDARALPDGRIALVVALPDNRGQAWLVKADRSMAQIGPDELPTTALAIAPDGGRIAYLAGPSGADKGFSYTADDYREVWVTAGRDRRKLTALPSGSDERLTDVAWAPDGEHLLLVAGRRSSDGDASSRLLWQSVQGGPPAELANLPAEVIPVSYSWSPAGDGVALLARSGDTVSLCALRTDGSAFRYLADIAKGDDRTLPHAPLSWSADSRRAVYSAPVKPMAYGNAGPQALYTDDLSGRPSVRLGEAEGRSPAWSDGNAVLALVREKAEGPLVLRAIDPKGATRDVGLLPLPGGAFAVRWDVAHARALVATVDQSGFSARRIYWLALWIEGEGR